MLVVNKKQIRAAIIHEEAIGTYFMPGMIQCLPFISRVTSRAPHILADEQTT